MYKFESRIRYSETDPEGYLKIESLLDYMQDCSTFQSEDLGIGISWLKEQSLAWLVNYWQVDIIRLPKLAERVRVGTSPYELKGFMGLRNFMMETSEGERLVNVHSVWSLMNIRTGVLVRVPQIMYEKYECFPRFEMEYTPRKIEDPSAEAGWKQTGSRSVTADENMLDSNGHVNNAQYVRLAMRELPHAGQMSRLRIEYRRQAHLHDTIEICSYENTARTESTAVRLCGEDGKPYAVLEAAAHLPE